MAGRLSLLGEEAARRDAERRALTLGEHVIELEKMKAAAQLAAGAAHDFRSVVSVVRWMARAIVEDTGGTETIAANASRILAVSESAMNVARDLEMVGRESQSAPEVVSAALELDRLEPVLSAAAGSGCNLVIRTGSAGLLLIDRAQLERLVLNLVVIARDAMPGGVVRVALGETVDGTGEVATYDATGNLLACLRPAAPNEPA